MESNLSKQLLNHEQESL